MKHHSRKAIRLKKAFRELVVAAAGLVLAASSFAQGPGSSPWENAVTVLQLAFTSTIARGLSLVAIVVSGLTFADYRADEKHDPLYYARLTVQKAQAESRAGGERTSGTRIAERDWNRDP